MNSIILLKHYLGTVTSHDDVLVQLLQDQGRRPEARSQGSCRVELEGRVAGAGLEKLPRDEG